MPTDNSPKQSPKPRAQRRSPKTSKTTSSTPDCSTCAWLRDHLKFLVTLSEQHFQFHVADIRAFDKRLSALENKLYLKEGPLN